MKQKWTGSDCEQYTVDKGIIPRDNQFFEIFDFPRLTKLVWDGHAGFSPGYIMDVDSQAM